MWWPVGNNDELAAKHIELVIEDGEFWDVEVRDV
jgi:hypothetical protein